ncbi:MAG: hypothetical protein C0522_12940, partial [Rhodocyclaceae bacterium]|nr:hypothetical protein [Rhodocyclaceae bacterium]
MLSFTVSSLLPESSPCGQPAASARHLACRLRSLLILGGLFLSQALGASPFESPAPATAHTQLDELVLADLAAHKLVPAAPCSDAVFIRRVHLDVIGTLPTAEETRTFLADRAPDK